MNFYVKICEVWLLQLSPRVILFCVSWLFILMQLSCNVALMPMFLFNNKSHPFSECATQASLTSIFIQVLGYYLVYQSLIPCSPDLI